jgi:hypothetical protein
MGIKDEDTMVESNKLEEERHLEHYARGNTWKKWCLSRRIPQEGHP